MTTTTRKKQMSNRRDYPRLSIEEFGKKLIESQDLDPVYVALYQMVSNDIMSQDQLYRWLLGYSCLYHCGLASYLSEYEGSQFFEKLSLAAENKTPSPVGVRWPRGKERRHWRGGQAEASCSYLSGRYEPRPEGFIEYIAFGPVPRSDKPVSFAEVSGRVTEHPFFGPWIAFKIADLIDRVTIRPVTFSFDEIIVYDTPLKAAEDLARQRLNLPAGSRVKSEVVKGVFAHLEEYFSNYAEPPSFDRPMSNMAIETVLCKHASHLRGHYNVYNDLREIHEDLLPWRGVSETASYFLASMPKAPDDNKES